MFGVVWLVLLLLLRGWCLGYLSISTSTCCGQIYVVAVSWVFLLLFFDIFDKFCGYMDQVEHWGLSWSGGQAGGSRFLFQRFVSNHTQKHFRFYFPIPQGDRGVGVTTTVTPGS